MYDLLFRQATIYDGSGSEPYTGDLAVEGDTIAAAGPPGPGDARRTVQAEGMALSPGFIDIHGHSDYYLLMNPTAQAKVRQGITTDVGGNCGYAAAPIGGGEMEERCAYYREEFGLDIPFGRLDEYLRHVEDIGISLNYAPLIGHNTIRASVMGGADRPAGPDDLAQMDRMTGEAMQEGAFGLSTGLVYAPACFADRAELTALCRTAARHGGLFATHMRSEGARLLEAIEEVIGIARDAGLPLQISHLKTAGKKNWDKLDAAFELIEGARAAGQDVTCDRYPYIASNTHLSALLPDWVHNGRMEEKIARLRDPAVRARIRADLEAAYPGPEYWKNVLISRVLTEENRACEGLTLAQAAEKREVDPCVAMMDLLAEEKMTVEILIFMMSEENMRRVLEKPYVMVGSDSAALTHEPPLGAGRPHPRNFGTFPAVLGNIARDEGLMPLAEAIRKMTSAPCDRLGINDRGRLTAGMKADLVLFDPGKIRDTATYEKPVSYPDGINMVLVNGEIVVEDGEHTGARSGRALRKMDRK
ncbi:MAG TPA: amidohydrolase [Nitrospinae bacterium]|nr:amidohydrolase [Nitrospinota bacterium]